MAMAYDDTDNRRPIIGVMVGHILSEYSQDYNVRLLNALRDEIEKIGGVLKIYTTVEYDSSLEKLNKGDESLGKHWVAGVGYAKFDAPCVMIVIYSTVVHDHSDEEIQGFLDSLPDIPIIVIGNRSLKVRNGYWCVIDGYSGMRKVVDHLIEEHGYKRFGMVSGSRKSNSATTRLQAFCDSLSAHGLSISEDMVVYGSYFHTADAIIEQLFDHDPGVEAIVAVSDEMCVSIYRIAKERGRIVGKDLAVCGYDNTPGSAFMDPPLTTVHADLAKMAKGVVEMIKGYLSTGKMESVEISSDPVFRCSCGCSFTPGEDTRTTLQEYLDQILDRRSVVEMGFRDAALALVLRGLVRRSEDFGQFFRQVGDSLHHIGCEASYILLHEKPVLVDDNPYLEISDNMRLAMMQKGESITAFDLFNSPVIGEGEAPRYVDADDTAGMRMEFLLFYGSYRYGVMCVFAKPDESSYYWVMSLQIGSGIRYLAMSLEQKLMSKELAEKNRLLYEQNQILDFSATHDGLTKLYNRVGYVQKTIEMIHASPDDTVFVAMMADVDHLKQINDMLGHAMGDLSITCAASILKQAVEGKGIVGRTGGDEFMVVFRQQSESDIGDIRHAILSGCGKFNEEDHPFYLGISMGSAVFTKEDSSRLAKVYEKADADLYENKKMRRANVIRGK